MHTMGIANCRSDNRPMLQLTADQVASDDLTTLVHVITAEEPSGGRFIRRCMGIELP